MKSCFEFLKNPSKWMYFFTFLLTLCLIALDFVCLFLWKNFVFVYAIYAISAIFLGYAIYLFLKICPKIKQKFVELFEKKISTRNAFWKTKIFEKVRLPFTEMLSTLGLGIFMIIKGQIKLLDLKKEQNSQFENDKIQNKFEDKGEENGQEI